MVGKIIPPILVTAEEMTKPSTAPCVWEIERCVELYSAYRAAFGWRSDKRTDEMMSHATMYAAGRLQGIREERLKRGESH